MERSVDFVAEKLGAFLRRGDQVLICLPEEHGSLFAQAVRQCGASAVVCGPDHRWKTLLRQAFAAKARAIIAPPLVILGLAKLTRATGTPLYMRNAVICGGDCTDWMRNGIRGGLDCGIWDAADWGIEPAEEPGAESELALLAGEINRWTSVLDCRLERDAGGLKIEIVVFPGEKLPRLPSCARLVVRPWNAELDVPFWVEAGWKNPVISNENH